MIKFICNKLTRDKTIERMKRFGITPEYTIIDTPEELITVLKQKLMEESLEVVEATQREDIIDELADVLEVIDGLKKAYGITQDDIMASKNGRFQERGGFEKGIFIKKIELEEDNDWVSHFRKTPNKYKEE